METLFILVAIPVIWITLWQGKKIIVRSSDENLVDWGNPLINLLDGFVRLFCHKYHRMPRQYYDIPETGAAIIVANHVSGLDPFIVLCACKRPVRFLIAREEYNRFGLKWLFKAVGCIPVDRDTRPEKAFQAALQALEAGEVVGVFPHGRIHWPNYLPGKIKGGAVRLAQRRNAMLYPAYIEGVGLSGFTLLALVVRSHIKVEFFPPMACTAMNTEQRLQELAQILNRGSNVSE